MKIGIVSDTHRNKEYLQTAVEWMTNRQKIATLYHLGDEYDDVMGLGDFFLELVQVPGTYDIRYKNGTLPAKTTETILGLNILLIHSIEKILLRMTFQGLILFFMDTHTTRNYDLTTDVFI